jgi:hypothetical protein
MLIHKQIKIISLELLLWWKIDLKPELLLSSFVNLMNVVQIEKLGLGLILQESPNVPLIQHSGIL